MSRVRFTSGFTLVELLVVIAVIALLMAMLMPALRKAKDAAIVAVCATHLDQMHTALHAGLIDRKNGRLPSTRWGETVGSPKPWTGGYSGDQFGFTSLELEELGWTYKVSLCPGITPDTGGDARRGFWYTRKPGGGGYGGSDYLYSGGRADHPGAATTPEQLKKVFGPPRFGFVFGKPGGIYYAMDEIYSGRISYDENGQNIYRDETYPSEVIYLGDVTYNGTNSYPGWYYGGSGYIDPSNHQDTSVADHKYGFDLWPALGRGSNRVKADGSIEWWNFPVKRRGRRSEARSYIGDYYTSYY